MSESEAAPTAGWNPVPPAGPAGGKAAAPAPARAHLQKRATISTQIYTQRLSNPSKLKRMSMNREKTQGGVNMVGPLNLAHVSIKESVEPRVSPREGEAPPKTSPTSSAASSRPTSASSRPTSGRAMRATRLSPSPDSPAARGERAAAPARRSFAHVASKASARGARRHTTTGGGKPAVAFAGPGPQAQPAAVQGGSPVIEEEGAAEGKEPLGEPSISTEPTSEDDGGPRLMFGMASIDAVRNTQAENPHDLRGKEEGQAVGILEQQMRALERQLAKAQQLKHNRSLQLHTLVSEFREFYQRRRGMRELVEEPAEFEDVHVRTLQMGRTISRPLLAGDNWPSLLSVSSIRAPEPPPTPATPATPAFSARASPQSFNPASWGFAAGGDYDKSRGEDAPSAPSSARGHSRGAMSDRTHYRRPSGADVASTPVTGGRQVQSEGVDKGGGLHSWGPAFYQYGWQRGRKFWDGRVVDPGVRMQTMVVRASNDHADDLKAELEERETILLHGCLLAHSDCMTYQLMLQRETKLWKEAKARNMEKQKTIDLTAKEYTQVCVDSAKAKQAEAKAKTQHASEDETARWRTGVLSEKLRKAQAARNTARDELTAAEEHIDKINQKRLEKLNAQIEKDRLDKNKAQRRNLMMKHQGCKEEMERYERLMSVTKTDTPSELVEVFTQQKVREDKARAEIKEKEAHIEVRNKELGDIEELRVDCTLHVNREIDKQTDGLEQKVLELGNRLERRVGQVAVLEANFANITQGVQSLVSKCEHTLPAYDTTPDKSFQRMQERRRSLEVLAHQDMPHEAFLDPVAAAAAATAMHAADKKAHPTAGRHSRPPSVEPSFDHGAAARQEGSSEAATSDQGVQAEKSHHSSSSMSAGQIESVQMLYRLQDMLYYALRRNRAFRTAFTMGWDQQKAPTHEPSSADLSRLMDTNAAGAD